MPRTIAWFSCGAASAIAAKIALDTYSNCIVARCVVENEHEDNSRFADDVANWLGVKIVNLRSNKYADCWDVWKKRRFLNGPKGAACTVEMKKKVRQEFSEPDDTHVFGFTSEEVSRASRFTKNNPEISSRFPLIENGYSKNDCFIEIGNAGIELPAMYRMGYKNANCVGCVKGGAGYWNKIRRDFPDVFVRMSELESELQASCIKGKPLATLLETEGRHDELVLPECGLFCGENE